MIRCSPLWVEVNSSDEIGDEAGILSSLCIVLNIANGLAGAKARMAKLLSLVQSPQLRPYERPALHA